jgi:Rieske Fe-S protein
VGAGAERLLEQPSATGGVDSDGTPPLPAAGSIALEGETTWLPVATVAALGGRAVSFFLNGIIGYVIHDTSSQQIIAMSAACTHMGCIVEWQDADRRFHCPCHGAMFTADGQGVNHSGYRYYLPPLPRLNARIRDGKVEVEVPKKK